MIVSVASRNAVPGSTSKVLGKLARDLLRIVFSVTALPDVARGPIELVKPLRSTVQYYHFTLDHADTKVHPSPGTLFHG
jgi:hypothetical protein